MGRLLDALLLDTGIGPAAIPAIPAIRDRHRLVKIAESQESQSTRAREDESTHAGIAESLESHGGNAPSKAPDHAGVPADPAEQSARLLCAIRSECLPDDLLGRDDSTPEQLAELSDATLRAYALALYATAEREAGRIPPSWNCLAHCEGCGPVWYWMPGRIAGCPWCWNRRALKPIPRPLVRCGDCRHFIRDAINPADGGGDCGAGLEYRGGSGPWPNVTRRCAVFRPLDDANGAA